MPYSIPDPLQIALKITDDYGEIDGRGIAFKLYTESDAQICELYVPSNPLHVNLKITDDYTPPASTAINLVIENLCYPPTATEPDPGPDPGPDPDPPPLPTNFDVSPGVSIPYQSAPHKQKHIKSRWIDSAFIPRHLKIGYQKPEQKNKSIQSSVTNFDYIDDHIKTPWQLFSFWRDVDIKNSWLDLNAIDCSQALPWEKPAPKQPSIIAGYSYPELKDQHTRFNFGQFQIIHDRDTVSGYSSPPPNDEFLTIKWGDQVYAEFCFREYQVPAWDQIHLKIYENTQGTLNFKFNDSDYPEVCTQQEPDGPRDTYPSYDPPAVVPTNPILSVYFFMHTLSVVKLPERTPIEVESLSISIDIDSWAYLFTANLLQLQDLAIIRPDENGVQEIEVNLDGYVWEFIVESYTDNRTFNERGYSISGRSKSAYLSDPYKLPISFTETTQRTAIQLIDNELATTGWTVNYNTVDWLVDANAFSYQNATSMQAIVQVSGAVGAVILPDRSLNQLNINARYPVSPWDWPSSIPVATITDDIMAQLSGDWQPKPDINGVYVTGGTLGVNCFVKRTGTAGDQLGEQVVDNLITHQDAGRERGRNIIADRGKQEIITVQVPVFPLGQTPGIFVPGDLLEISQSGTLWQGQVVAVAVTAELQNDALSATQTITLERHHGNN